MKCGDHDVSSSSSMWCFLLGSDPWLLLLSPAPAAIDGAAAVGTVSPGPRRRLLQGAQVGCPSNRRHRGDRGATPTRGHDNTTTTSCPSSFILPLFFLHIRNLPPHLTSSSSASSSRLLFPWKAPNLNLAICISARRRACGGLVGCPTTKSSCLIDHCYSLPNVAGKQFQPCQTHQTYTCAVSTFFL